MAWLILLIVLSLPAIEIVLFVESVHLIGGLATLALATLAIVGGFSLLRQQGLAVLWRARAQRDAGGTVGSDLFDTLCLSLAGLLLVLPGFLTDILALPLLVPAIRHWLRRRLAGRLFSGPERKSSSSGGASVIEGDFRVVEPTAADLPPVRTPDRD